MIHHRAGGFTLIEVLVATAILAAVMTAAMGVYSSSLAGSGKLGEYQRAVDLAQDRLARIGTRFDVAAANTQGETDDGYRWRVQLQPYTPAAGETLSRPLRLQPYEVRVSVGWKHGARAYHFELRSIRLGRPS
jgi:general secretion pathway protein I